MTPDAVVRLLLKVLSAQEVEAIVWKWVQTGVLVKGSPFQWSEEQKAKGGTIRW